MEQNWGVRYFSADYLACRSRGLITVTLILPQNTLALEEDRVSNCLLATKKKKKSYDNILTYGIRTTYQTPDKFSC